MLNRANFKVLLPVLLLALGLAFLVDRGSVVIEPPPEQWYLTGDSKFIVDIGWSEMWENYASIPNSQKNSVRVAVIDTGIDEDNPEIKDCVIETGRDSRDEIGHGTKIAGIICASQYTGLVAGISDISKTEIVPIKVITDGDSPSEIESLVEAIKLAESQGCSICNISLNTSEDEKTLKESIATSEMLFVVSSGNGETVGKNIDKQSSYPASYDFDNLVTVTNVKSNGRLNSTANYGQCVDIAAPGTEIYNLDIDNGYSASTGTSFATPVVTGLAAMLYICDEKMTAEQCKEIILSSATQERRLKGKIKNNRIVKLDAALKKAVQ